MGRHTHQRSRHHRSRRKRGEKEGRKTRESRCLAPSWILASVTDSADHPCECGKAITLTLATLTGQDQVRCRTQKSRERVITLTRLAVQFSKLKHSAKLNTKERYVPRIGKKVAIQALDVSQEIMRTDVLTMSREILLYDGQFFGHD